MKRSLFLLVILLVPCSLWAGEVDTLAVSACRKLCDEYVWKMSETIHNDILEKGIEGAVASCAEKAEAFCAEKTKEPGLVLERITLRELKDQKRLESFEATVLRAMAEAARAGKEVPRERYLWKETEKQGGELLYIRPLKVEPTCLICHGPSNMVQPKVREIMQTKYNALPSGDKVGDVKGAVLVRLKLPEARRFVQEMGAKKEKE